MFTDPEQEPDSKEDHQPKDPKTQEAQEVGFKGPEESKVRPRQN